MRQCHRRKPFPSRFRSIPQLISTPPRVADSSRWSSAAIPPEPVPAQIATPTGVAENNLRGRNLRPLRGRNSRGDAFRWCRCAQPPAIVCDPTGSKSVRDANIGRIAALCLVSTRSTTGFFLRTCGILLARFATLNCPSRSAGCDNSRYWRVTRFESWLDNWRPAAP